MPAERRFGMDHEHYDWSPFIKRGILRWPKSARVALCVIVNLERMEWDPPEGTFTAANLAGGLGPRPFPDYARMSHREYGHRVGIFRVLDVLERHGIKPTVAMDALTAETYPYLVEHCQKRGCEIIGHGISVSRMISGNMSEQEELEYIRTSVDALRRTTWLSAGGVAGAGVRRVFEDAPTAGAGGNPVRVRLGERRAALSHKYSPGGDGCPAHHVRVG